MRDDIPTRLRDTAADPSHTPDFDAGAVRGRRRHLAGRTTMALVTVVALLVAGTALWSGGGSANRMPATGDAPTATTPPPTPAGPALPPGWHEIRVGDAVLGIPGDWVVEELREPTTVCPNMADRPTAHLHLAGMEEGVCQTRAAHALTVEIAPLSGLPDLVLDPDGDRQWEAVSTSAGLGGQRLVRDDIGLVVAYRFPELDLWLQFADGEVISTQADPILDTVARAPDRAAPAGRGDLPPDWQPVEVGEASFGVPGDWATAHVNVMATSCPNVLDTPTVLVLDLDQPNMEPAGCDLGAGTVPTLTAGSLSTWHDLPNVRRVDRDGDPVMADGHGGERFVHRDEAGREAVTYEFEELDLLLWFRRVDLAPDLPEEVLTTLTATRPDPKDATASELPGEEGIETSLALPRPVPDDPDVRTRSGAAGRAVACEGPLHMGGWALDFGGPAIGADDPGGALQAFLDMGLFGIPRDGYRRAAADVGRVLFTHDVDGVAKVAVIVADSTAVAEDIGVEDGWAIETFATCDPAEYGAGTDDQLGQTVWTDRDGTRVPTSTITTHPGHAHCDWQSVTFLHLDDRQFLRDPQHLLSDHTVTPYAGDTQLPDDAVDTGYRHDGRELWLGPGAAIAYVVSASTVEAWPSTTTPVGCA